MEVGIAGCRVWVERDGLSIVVMFYVWRFEPHIYIFIQYIHRGIRRIRNAVIIIIIIIIIIIKEKHFKRSFEL